MWLPGLGVNGQPSCAASTGISAADARLPGISVSFSRATSDRLPGLVRSTRALI